MDLSRETLLVRQSLVEIGSELVFQEPKTPSGRRTVALSPTCGTALHAHRTRQGDQRRLLGSAWRDLNLVFTTADGGPIAPRNVIRRFKQLTAQADLPAIAFHGTRHTHATLLMACTRRSSVNDSGLARSASPAILPATSYLTCSGKRLPGSILHSSDSSRTPCDQLVTKSARRQAPPKAGPPVALSHQGIFGEPPGTRTPNPLIKKVSIAILGVHRVTYVQGSCSTASIADGCHLPQWLSKFSDEIPVMSGFIREPAH